MCEVIELFPKKLNVTVEILPPGSWSHRCEARGGKLTTWQNDFVVCPLCFQDNKALSRPGRHKRD